MNCQNKFHREYTIINQSNFIIHVYFWKKIIHRLLFSNFLKSVNLLRTFITAHYSIKNGCVNFEHCGYCIKRDIIVQEMGGKTHFSYCFQIYITYYNKVLYTIRYPE